MSIDINWETLTGGPDGVALAESIRAFVDDRFQKVTLPRMIRSVKVHSFDFGSVTPTIELKDVCDPLPDFYDDGSDDDENETVVDPPIVDESVNRERVDRRSNTQSHSDAASNSSAKMPPPFINLRTEALRSIPSRNNSVSGAFLSRTATPGFLGSTSSNLGYFHLPLSAGLSGTSTPLAAVAGAQYQHPWPEHAHSNDNHHRSTSFGSISPPSSANNSRPTSRHQQDWTQSQLDRTLSGTDGHDSPTPSNHTAEREKSAEDIQIVSHISYSGNIRLSLTAEILLDYPMESFVGIPLKLNITGLTFDGVAILAYIKKKAHFCFLCPEDADALIGSDVDLTMSSDTTASPKSPEQRHKVGALLEEIKVESEIGQKEGGKQVLKNVGKVEKFVLEQVRRIFEDEFVYPSFWTFLV